jgi:4-amino-4-deoxy-L-arabinose transferase-like glycosyltransferase
VLFGVWALVHVAVFSFQQGIFHPYYASALAPAVAALSGGGLVAMWAWARGSWAGTAALSAAVALTAYVALVVLGRTPDFAPWLRYAVYAGAVLAAIGLAMRRQGLLGRRAVAAVAVALAIATAAGRPPTASRPPAARSTATTSRPVRRARAASAGRAAGRHERQGSVSTETIAWLQAHQGSAKYLVAATGSQTTAGIIIASGEPVVTIGGFNGGDPAPTVAQLEAMVKAGELEYVLVGGGMGGGPGGGASSSELSTWVQEHAPPSRTPA